MKIGWLIVGGVAAYLVYKTYQVAKAISMMQVNIKSIRYDASNSTIFQTEFAVTINVNNLTAQPLNFTSFFGRVYIKNVPVASFGIGNNNGVVINPGENEMVFPVVISNLNIAADIQQIINTWKTDYSDALVGIQGDLTAGGVTVPINQTLLLNQDAVINGAGELIMNDEIPAFLANSMY